MSGMTIQRSAGRALTETEAALYALHCQCERERFIEAQQRRRHAETDGEAAWMIAMTAPSAERRATDAAEALGFDVWWPMRRIEVRNRYIKRSAGDGVFRDYPAWPGYLFIRPRAGIAWQMIRDADGIRGVLKKDLRADEGPVLILDAKIEALRAFLAPLAMPVVEDALRIGDRVILAEGPFMSFDAVVERLCGTKITVEISIFGRATSTQVEAAQLVRSDRMPKKAEARA